MKEYSFKAGNKDAGKRLDLYLVEKLGKDSSRSHIQKLIKSENVLLNKNETFAHHKISPGDEIRVVFAQPQAPDEVKAEKIPLDIIYEDESIIVINKPAGMVVHPAAGNFSRTLANALLHHCKRLSQEGGPLRPGIVHRLDKDTSGLMIAVKTDAAHRDIAKQFKQRQVERRYIAIVKGVVQVDTGKIDFPIGRHPRNRKKMAVSYLDAKPAETSFKVLKRFKDATLLEITPITGRTHQIRVHMASYGHALLGDPKYGKKGGLTRQALHAYKIKFRHPDSDKIVEFESPLPRDLEEYIEKKGQALF